MPTTRKRITRPRQSPVELTPAMLRASERGDYEFFVKALALKPWDFHPFQSALDESCAELKGLCSHEQFMKMRKLRHALMRAAGVPVPRAPKCTCGGSDE